MLNSWYSSFHEVVPLVGHRFRHQTNHIKNPKLASFSSYKAIHSSLDSHFAAAYDLLLFSFFYSFFGTVKGKRVTNYNDS